MADMVAYKNRPFVSSIGLSFSEHPSALRFSSGVNLLCLYVWCYECMFEPYCVCMFGFMYVCLVSCMYVRGIHAYTLRRLGHTYIHTRLEVSYMHTYIHAQHLTVCLRSRVYVCMHLCMFEAYIHTRLAAWDIHTYIHAQKASDIHTYIPFQNAWFWLGKAGAKVSKTRQNTWFWNIHTRLRANARWLCMYVWGMHTYTLSSLELKVKYKLRLNRRTHYKTQGFETYTSNIQA